MFTENSVAQQPGERSRRKSTSRLCLLPSLWVCSDLYWHYQCSLGPGQCQSLKLGFHEENHSNRKDQTETVLISLQGGKTKPTNLNAQILKWESKWALVKYDLWFACRNSLFTVQRSIRTFARWRKMGEFILLSQRAFWHWPKTQHNLCVLNHWVHHRSNPGLHAKTQERLD